MAPASCRPCSHPRAPASRRASVAAALALVGSIFFAAFASCTRQRAWNKKSPHCAAASAAAWYRFAAKARSFASAAEVARFDSARASPAGYRASCQRKAELSKSLLAVARSFWCRLSAASRASTRATSSISPCHWASGAAAAAPKSAAS